MMFAFLRDPDAAHACVREMMTRSTHLLAIRSAYEAEADRLFQGLAEFQFSWNEIVVHTERYELYLPTRCKPEKAQLQLNKLDYAIRLSCAMSIEEKANQVAYNAVDAIKMMSMCDIDTHLDLHFPGKNFRVDGRTDVHQLEKAIFEHLKCFMGEKIYLFDKKTAA